MTRIPRSGLAHVPGEAEHGQALPVGLPPALRGPAAAEEIRPRVGAPPGPGRQSPDLGVHELFEGHVRAHPRTPATVEGERSWTYAQLNTRANRLASVLLARGLVPGEVVAVVTERNLEWLAAVLGIFKAGGAYLPLDPCFPADRIATVLWRSGCRLAVTQAESGETLEAARADLAASGDGGEIDVLDLELLDVDISDPDNLGVEAGPDRLAYLCPTDAGGAGGRGSTGEPEGTPGPHVYRLNHVLAKIEELGIGPGDVVAQTAPPCLDVSLWQMVTALCVGGRTLIVGQETLLDAERFVDTIERGAVTILQASPAQLKAVLEHLDAYPRPLPHLRYVCATGEGLETELAGHRFAAHGVHIAQAGRCPPPGGRSVPCSPGPVAAGSVRQCPMDPIDPTERLPHMRYPFVAAPPAVVRPPDTPPATLAQPDTTLHDERALDREGDRG